MNNLSIPLLSPNFMLYKDDEDNKTFYLFNVNEGSVFELNSVSYDFLELCDGKHNCEEIFGILSTTYSIDKLTLQNDFTPIYTSWVETCIILEQ